MSKCSCKNSEKLKINKRNVHEVKTRNVAEILKIIPVRIQERNSQKNFE